LGTLKPNIINSPTDRAVAIVTQIMTSLIILWLNQALDINKHYQPIKKMYIY